MNSRKTQRAPAHQTMIPIGKYLYNVVVQRCATRLEKLPHFETDSIFSMRLTDHDLQYCFYKKIPGTWYWKTSAAVKTTDWVLVICFYAYRYWYTVRARYDTSTRKHIICAQESNLNIASPAQRTTFLLRFTAWSRKGPAAWQQQQHGKVVAAAAANEFSYFGFVESH